MVDQKEIHIQENVHIHQENLLKDLKFVFFVRIEVFHRAHRKELKYDHDELILLRY